MADKEKAISCLTDVENILIARQDICPREELQYWIELQEGVADAISLLKEQEAVKPIVARDHDTPDMTLWYVCPKCRIAIDYLDKYCRHCGKEMEWE